MVERLNKKLENREMIVGAYVFGGLPIMTEAMAQCGFDVLWIDMEHTAIGIDTLTNNLIAAKAGGTPAWVRIPWNDPVRAKPVLDMGADGIIFPYVRTAEEARLAVQSCAYPPEGIRGYGPLRALDYGNITQMEFVKKTFRRCRRLIQIEHIDAVKNLREIAAVEGVDGFIVGPNDLSGSVGLIGEVRHPKLIELYEEIASVLKEMGKPFGVATGPNEEFLQLWIDLGATILFAGNDVGFVHDGAVAMRNTYTKLLSK
jgi:2-dehydro-3-deoxyglucarate aldolase/4-hydroxy-2-oxoheptanedioate aldolase